MCCYEERKGADMRCAWRYADVCVRVDIKDSSHNSSLLTASMETK